MYFHTDDAATAGSGSGSGDGGDGRVLLCAYEYEKLYD